MLPMSGADAGASLSIGGSIRSIGSIGTETSARALQATRKRKSSLLERLSRFRLRHAKRRTRAAPDVPVTPKRVQTPSAVNGWRCPICLESDCTVVVRLAACDHRICADCLKRHAEIRILSVDARAACPLDNCAAYLSDGEVATVVDEASFQRYQLITSFRKIDADAQLVWCPRPGCCTAVSRVVHACASASDRPGVFLRCPICATIFCADCHGSRQLHSGAGTTCDAIRRHLDESLRGLSMKTIKRCPNCQVPVQRDDGCAQMLCLNCRHLFCWWCLANLSDDLLLLHYNNGPCRGRLGHTMPNLLWHRVQTVLLLGGAGLTVIVLSPLLIVAVPLYVGVKHARRLVKTARARRRDAPAGALDESHSSPRAVGVRTGNAGPASDTV